MQLLLIAICIVTIGRLGSTIALHNTISYQLTATALSAYVNKTFGPSQRCLKIAFDDSVESSAIAAMFHDSDCGATCRTIDLDDTGDGPIFCPAYVVVGRQQKAVERFMENFRYSAAERMLVIIVQHRKYIKPFIKVSFSPVRRYNITTYLHSYMKSTGKNCYLSFPLLNNSSNRQYKKYYIYIIDIKSTY